MVVGKKVAREELDAVERAEEINVNGFKCGLLGEVCGRDAEALEDAGLCASYAGIGEEESWGCPFECWLLSILVFRVLGLYHEPLL